MSFNSADTRMEKHQSESKLFLLDQLIKKPWFVQMHYGDFKSNLSWKHESIDKNGFFSEVAWKNPRNEICLWYWFAGLLQRILGKTIRYNMK